MKEDQNNRLDASSEYDFSKGIRGKYVKELGGPDAPWIAEMAARDAQRWIAEGLLRFQRLEGSLVAYFALLHNHKAIEAGLAASQALENPGSRSLAVLLRDLKTEPDSPTELIERLLHVLQERNWLVHRAFHSGQFEHVSDFVSRVMNAATEATRAESALHQFILARCESAGIPARETERKAATVIKEWAAA